MSNMTKIDDTEFTDNEMRKPTENQLNALLEFANRSGKHWKKDLRECWQAARYPYHLSTDCSAYLQQVRNQLGPSWLAKFQL